MEKLFSCIILLAIAALWCQGCIAEENITAEGLNTSSTGGADADPALNETMPAQAAEQNSTETNATVVNTTYTADLNLTELAMKIDETVLISLSENPTTGYSWNVTNSSGLSIVNETYTMDAAKEKMAGAGGVHSWTARAVEAGNQSFSAVMTHVAEKPTGNEETYTLNVTVSGQ
jgi:inhibitor of cysteine peptidase